MLVSKSHQDQCSLHVCFTKVQAAMDSYLLSKERVDDKFQWMCEGPSCTGILAGCDKIRNVVKCPEVLVLHLVRWAEDGSPLQHHVEAEQCIKVLRGASLKHTHSLEWCAGKASRLSLATIFHLLSTNVKNI